MHQFLGNGLQEVIYQRALSFEFARVGLTFAREIEQDIFYKECPEPIGTRRADFVVEGKVLVELKAIADIGGCTHRSDVELPESLPDGSGLIN